MRPILILPVAALVLAPYGAWPQDNPVGPEFQINTYTTYQQGSPSVAADSAGNFVVVWQSVQDGWGYGVFGQRFLSTGQPVGPEFRVNTYTTERQKNPSVAADSSGNFVVVWQSRYQDGSGYGVFGQRYASSGAPLGPEFAVNTFTTYGQLSPHIASDPSGNFVVVWSGVPVPASPYDVFGRRYASSGVPFGPEFLVNTYTTGFQTQPNLVVDPSGSFVVTWSGFSDANTDVFAQRYSSSGTPLGPEFRVNAFTPGSHFNASLAADSSGNFVIVWSDPGGNGDIQGQLFASSGSPIGPNFTVNAYTTGIQGSPSVAADPSGHFIVVWESFLQDGSEDGVFGQRFDSMTVPVELMMFGVE